jgi:elongation factor 1-beta
VPKCVNIQKCGENCTLSDVAFGIKKIQCTITWVNKYFEIVREEIEAMEAEVRNVEVTSIDAL